MNLSICISDNGLHAGPVINIHLPGTSKGRLAHSDAAMTSHEPDLATGDGEDALEAMGDISRALGTQNTLEDMLHAIELLQAPRGRNTGHRFQALDASLQPTNVGSHAYVRDNTSGLIWTARNVSEARLDWEAADKACKALGDGWRLPTRSELLTLVDDTRFEPCIDTELFPGTKPNWYWTGTPAAWSAECAWVVYFLYGLAGSYLRSLDAFVRAVRVAAPAGQ